MPMFEISAKYYSRNRDREFLRHIEADNLQEAMKLGDRAVRRSIKYAEYKLDVKEIRT